MMIRTITLGWLLLSAVVVTAQDVSHKKCKDCLEIVYERYLKSYTAGKKQFEVVKRNMTEYFEEDLEKLLPAPANAHVSVLKFDALGCVYADQCSPKFKKGGFCLRKNGFNNTFFKSLDGDTTKISALCPPPTESTSPVITDAALRNTAKLTPDSTMLKWRKDWNKIYLTDAITDIKKKLTDKHITRIVFLVHGYNVPYAVAQIQDNNLIALHQKHEPELSKNTLFIKVFWPSLAMKRVKQKRKILCIKNELAPRTIWNFGGVIKREVVIKKYVVIKNKLTPRTIWNFSRVINRSLLVGLGLREVLNGIADFNGEVLMMGHSMGCPTISAVFINPNQKLTVNDTRNPFWNKEDVGRLDFFKKEFQSVPLKKYDFSRIGILLNAPAMPGIETFNKSDMGRLNKIHWTIGFNPTDKVLNKTFSIFRFGDQNGNTRLGGNWEDEAWKTYDYLKKEGLEGNFTFYQSGYQYDLFGHDFFCYLLQKSFQEKLQSFLKQVP